MEQEYWPAYVKEAISDWTSNLSLFEWKRSTHVLKWYSAMEFIYYGFVCVYQDKKVFCFPLFIADMVPKWGECATWKFFSCTLAKSWHYCLHFSCIVFLNTVISIKNVVLRLWLRLGKWLSDRKNQPTPTTSTADVKADIRCSLFVCLFSHY